MGTPVRVPFGTQTTSGYVVGLSPSVDREVKSVTSVDERLPVLPADLVSLASWMADHYVCSVGEAIDAMLPPRARSASLEPPLPRAAVRPIGASGDGQAVIDLLGGAAAPRIAIIADDARFEAYAAAIRWALQRDSAVIVLEPEVAQAERMAAWVERKVGVPVALYHGAQGAPDRRNLWRSIASGGSKVVVGTRSAVFAPVAPLGLIIVDREEDTSYKEERIPRYHARTVAEMRARLAPAAIIWGTPTPSLEIIREADEGRAARLSLPGPGRAMIAVADVRAEAGPVGGLFGRRLYQALARTLPRGRALLYVPRRGYADFLLCHECGAVT
ncbi:MAG: hypothetical protein HYU65_03480, partial [Armatimonadetes bacterium]|nr:hypothetical protein [Armatimonadota bacterium]